MAVDVRDRESATSILGWPLANPVFSSRICFVMTLRREVLSRAGRSSGEPFAHSRKKGRFAHGKWLPFVRIEEW
jgi:hypothetical protein